MKVLILSSSTNEVDPYYLSIAKSLSQYIAKSNCELVFEANSCEIINLCYDEFIKYNCKTYAYATEKNKDNLPENENTNCYLCQSTFELKKCLFEASDMIICLPGGLETYEKLLSFISAKLSEDVNIPIIIYDEDGFYNNFEELLKDKIKKGFMGVEILGTYVITHGKEEFVNEFEKYLYKL